MDVFDKFEFLIKKLLKKSNLSISCIVGAGLSAGSGLSTFRGEDGLYRGKDPMELASKRGFIEDPELVWTWYKERIEKVFEATPNEGHMSLVELEKMGLLHTILTQNVDGLHLQAGQSPNKIVEVHGTLSRTHCLNNCGKNFILSKPPKTVPVVCDCGSYQRPSVVWFGETLNLDLFEILEDIQLNSNLLFVIGTSGVVYPIAQIPHILSKSMHVININPDISGFSDISDISFDGKAEKILPKLIMIIKNNL